MLRAFALIALVPAVFGARAVMPPSAVSGQGWSVTATAADTVDSYYAPAVGNGQIALVMDRTGMQPAKAFSATTLRRGRDTKVSSIIPTISALNLTIEADGKDSPVTDWTQTLDMRQGCVHTSYVIPGLAVSCTMTALRSMPFATLATVIVTAARPVNVTVTNHPAIPSSLASPRVSDRRFTAGHIPRQLLRAEASYNHGADFVVATSGFIAPGWRQDSPSVVSVSLAKGESATLTAVASTLCTADFSDPWNESERQVLYAITNGPDNLMARHRRAWDELWQGDIIIDGDADLQAHARAALYNLYASAAPGSGRSIAPMGLTSTHYYGHIFWDADTWMLPVMAVLSPKVARDMADYRIATLPAARVRAAAHGYKGAMYAWESDDLGEESTPTFALTGPLEHHVTADVARGVWLSFCADRDTLWLRDKAWPLLRDCADFWVSRVERNADGTYSINGVVGADEYAINVDDNAFTNAAAMRSLQYAVQAARLLGLTPDPAWDEVARGLRFHYVPGHSGVIAEYAGYDSQTIKQADVALLAFPLDLLTGTADIEANIDYYDSRIDSLNGPAMSHSAMAVNYARLGDPSRAARLIDRAYRPNLRGPFHNLSESPGNNHTYFITAAGGLLQALVFGYAGLDIDTEGGGIRQLPSSLPPDIRGITVKTPVATYRR